MTTSATGGYLSPLLSPAPTPVQDDDFDDVLQAIVVGITGLNGSLVRPRWQPNDPKQPDRTVNWCAIGITNITPDATAYVHHHSLNNVDDLTAYDELQRHELVEVLASFYGPGGRNLAELLRDGFSIAQNREAMFLANMGFVDVENVLVTGDLVNQGFIRRVDLSFRVRRLIKRNYAVLNIREAQGEIDTDLPNAPKRSTPISVKP